MEQITPLQHNIDVHSYRAPARTFPRPCSPSVAGNLMAAPPTPWRRCAQPRRWRPETASRARRADAGCRTHRKSWTAESSVSSVLPASPMAALAAPATQRTG